MYGGGALKGFKEMLCLPLQSRPGALAQVSRSDQDCARSAVHVEVTEGLGSPVLIRVHFATSLTVSAIRQSLMPPRARDLNQRTARFPQAMQGVRLTVPFSILDSSFGHRSSLSCYLDGSLLGWVSGNKWRSQSRRLCGADPGPVTVPLRGEPPLSEGEAVSHMQRRGNPTGSDLRLPGDVDVSTALKT
ncbi:uncharacterized protein LOC135370419 [Ornithodoros turicata]|uniref:uncharacterized protein LOC135370419 n=1 Tax=Ornithodoros turicata TaxID=34597 RepID=UPI003139CC2D